MEPGNASYPNCALLPLLLCGSDCPVKQCGTLLGIQEQELGRAMGIHLPAHLISTLTRRPQPRRQIGQAASNLQGFKIQAHTVTGRD